MANIVAIWLRGVEGVFERGVGLGVVEWVPIGSKGALLPGQPPGQKAPAGDVVSTEEAFHTCKN